MIYERLLMITYDSFFPSSPIFRLSLSYPFQRLIFSNLSVDGQSVWLKKWPRWRTTQRSYPIGLFVADVRSICSQSTKREALWDKQSLISHLQPITYREFVACDIFRLPRITYRNSNSVLDHRFVWPDFASHRRNTTSTSFLIDIYSLSHISKNDVSFRLVVQRFGKSRCVARYPSTLHPHTLLAHRFPLIAFELAHQRPIS